VILAALSVKKLGAGPMRELARVVLDFNGTQIEREKAAIRMIDETP
jgi:hypothetical protein